MSVVVDPLFIVWGEGGCCGWLLLAFVLSSFTIILLMKRERESWLFFFVFYLSCGCLYSVYISCHGFGLWLWHFLVILVFPHSVRTVAKVGEKTYPKSSQHSNLHKLLT